MKQGLWIPIEILQLSDISWSEKAVLSMVLNFSRKTGKCTARNSTIAESLNISIRSAENVTTRLIKKGYLTSTGKGPNRDLTIHSERVNKTLNLSELNTQNECIKHSKRVNKTLNLSEFPKEDKREDKREIKGKEMSLRDNPPHADLKKEVLENDKRRDGENSDEDEIPYFERYLDELLS